MDVLGLPELAKALEKFAKRVKDAAAAAVYQEACQVMGESVKECPVDKGRLRQSNYVAPPQDLDNPTAQVGYGAEYGVYVHERTDLKHNAPTKDHFLSDPMIRALEGYTERLNKRTQRNIEKNVGLGNTPKLYPKTPKT